MPQVLDIQVEVPDAVSEQNLKIAEAVARQAVIIALQQRGELTIREAAAALNLTYEQYLQVLAEEKVCLSGRQHTDRPRGLRRDGASAPRLDPQDLH